MRVKEPSTTIIFIRHGSTDFPEDRVYKGDNGPNLNTEGRLQAERLGGWIREGDISAIFVSPTTRTIETATPIVKTLKLEYKILDDLKERGFGIWEGLTFREIEDQYPDGLEKWKRDPINYTPQDGESIIDLQKRVSDVVQHAIQEHRGEKVVMVTHMGPIRVAIAMALQIPLTNYRHVQIHPGSATRIDYGITAANLIYLSAIPGGNRP
ncbi:MAG: histidine phosphatase family protein [Nitrospirae bacterium]|nr:histidine phosphatase family protein [Nitrospirota bacterium]MBI5097454.1 histidine phosphatase family protein [Nitrospirota bacterium]